ncbi:MAG TPA: DUF427 domain-containing protein [Phenylobacterium sp.]|uniref:DUF427 domain-containing protein n=1 Tax=Phenylobacterium sp. TaxID=1871053 RepID=UPI002F926125
MLTPGPDHPIDIKPAKTYWRVMYGEHVIADSGDALVLQEADYPPVVYFPRADVSMEYLARTDHKTHCPYKGEASYYTLLMDGRMAENAVWTYEEPYPAMEQIRSRLAFYPDKVEIYAVEDKLADPRHPHAAIDEIVQHTDSGAGSSQRDHWPPNVSAPRDGGVV